MSLNIPKLTLIVTCVVFGGAAGAAPESAPQEKCTADTAPKGWISKLFGVPETCVKLPVAKPPVVKAPVVTPPVEKPPAAKPPVVKAPVATPPAAKPPVVSAPVGSIPKAPEIDAPTAVGALTLLLGGLMVLRGRRARA